MAEQEKQGTGASATSGSKSATTTANEAAPKPATDIEKVKVTDEGGTTYIPAAMKTVSPEQEEGLTGAGTSTAASSAGSEKPHNTTVSAEYTPPKADEPVPLGTLVENIPDMNKSELENQQAAKDNSAEATQKASKEESDKQAKAQQEAQQKAADKRAADLQKQADDAQAQADLAAASAK